MQGVTLRPWPYAAQLQSYLPYRLGGLVLRSYTLHFPVIHFAAFEENLRNLSCGANLTELHVQVCTQNYSTRDRHIIVMNALASFFRSAGLQVVCEEQVPGDTQKRYDASISNPSDPASSSV